MKSLLNFWISEKPAKLPAAVLIIWFTEFSFKTMRRREKEITTECKIKNLNCFLTQPTTYREFSFHTSESGNLEWRLHWSYPQLPTLQWLETTEFNSHSYDRVGFPGGSDGKESTSNAGGSGSIRKIPWMRKWHPTPVLLPGKSHGQRSLVGCSPWGH